MPLWRTLSEPCRCCPPSARCRRRFQAMASPPGRMLTAPGACRSPAALRRRGRDRSPRPKLAARSRSPRSKTGRPDPGRRGQTGRPIPVAAAKDWPSDPERRGQRLIIPVPLAVAKDQPSDPRRRGQSWLSDPGRRRGYGGSRCHGAGGPACRVVPLLAGRRGPRHAPLSGAVSPLHGVARAVQPLGPGLGPARSPRPH
jgi:hypothetical protein